MRHPDSLDLAEAVIKAVAEDTLEAAKDLEDLSAKVLLDQEAWTELAYEIGNFTLNMVDIVIRAMTGDVPTDPQALRDARMRIIEATAKGLRDSPKKKRPGNT